MAKAEHGWRWGKRCWMGESWPSYQTHWPLCRLWFLLWDGKPLGILCREVTQSDLHQLPCWASVAGWKGRSRRTTEWWARPSELFEPTGFVVDVECERRESMMTSLYVVWAPGSLELLLTETEKIAGRTALEDVKSSVLSTLGLRCLLVKSWV